MAGDGAGERHPRAGPAGVDLLSALRGVRLADEGADGDVHEVRIAEVALPIGERELEDLRDRMQVAVGAVPRHADVGRLGDGERFEQERALGPGAAGVHLDLLVVEAEAAGDRGHDRTAERFQVFRREQSVVCALVCEDPARDVAAIERPAHRRQPGHAVVAGRAFLVAEELQGTAEIGLDQPVTGRRDLAVRHPDCDVLRPVPEVVRVPAHVVEHHGVAGEAPGCVAHRARRHVAERHRAPALQGPEARIGGGRRHRAPYPERDLAAVAFDERIGVEGARPASDPGDGGHLPGVGEPDDHRRDPRHAHLVAVHHPEGEDGGDPRVDRVAAVLQRLESG